MAVVVGLSFANQLPKTAKPNHTQTATMATPARAVSSEVPSSLIADMVITVVIAPGPAIRGTARGIISPSSSLSSSVSASTSLVPWVRLD